MRRTFSFVILLALLAGSAFAQSSDPSRPWYGVYGDFNFNRHTADFAQLPGSLPCCPNIHFTSGDGQGFSAGLSYQLPLSARIALDVRAGWYGYDATLKKNEPVIMQIDSVLVDGNIEHVIEASLGSIGIEPLVDISVWNGLSFLVGPRIGVVITGTHHRFEHIVSPDRGLFADTQSSVRDEHSGDLPDALEVHAALVTGVRYRIPLDTEGSICVVPEVLASIGLTPVVSGYNWYAHSLRLGVAVQWNSALWGR